MEPRPLSYVAEACQGEWVQGDPSLTVSSICTDSRKAQPGELFFALRGDRFDGHNYLREVAAQGVAGVVVKHGTAASHAFPCAVIKVDDPRVALGRLAARYRAGFIPHMVAVGGSNGKTTTKELLAAVLGQRMRVLSSPASFNNDVGVPLTLLQLDRGHEAAVVEVGTNHPGELVPLLGMIRPELGVITSLGREHLEFFGDLDGVIQEEGALAESLPAHGKLFLNGESPGAGQVRQRSGAASMQVGFQSGFDWQARLLEIDEQGTRFEVRAPNRHFNGEYRVGLLGRYQVTNALLALAVAEECGVNPEEARRGLLLCPQPRMRMQLLRFGRVQVLDDSYNANADSVSAALETLCSLPCAARRWAVLGDMAELGGHSGEAHREVGQRAGELGIDRLVAIGEWAKVTGEAARSAGLREVQVFDQVESALETVPSLLGEGDVVLVKGSRVSGLERFVAALRTQLGV